MTRISVNFLSDALGGPAGARGHLVASTSRARTSGTVVTAPAPVRVNFADGALESDLILEPSGVTWYWNLEVTYGGTFVRISRNVVIPDVEEIDWDDLVDVDPATMLPDPGAVPAWQAAVAQVAALLSATESARGEAVQAAADAVPAASEAVEARDDSKTYRDQAEVFAAGTVVLQDAAIAQAISTPGVAQDALNATTAAQIDAALEGVGGGVDGATESLYPAKAALDAGQTFVIGNMSDSTSAGEGKWLHNFTNGLAERYPNHTVRIRHVSTTTEEFPEPTVIRQGPLGPRRVYFDGTTVATRSLPANMLVKTSPDLDVRALVLADDWAENAPRTLMGQYGAEGQRAWYFWLNNNTLRLTHSPDGSTAAQLVGQTTAGSLAAIPFVPGQPMWLRATLDVDNGSSGHTKTFYYSTNGETWTMIGSPVVVAGVTAVASVAQPIDVGSYNAGWGGKFKGYIYEVDARDGIGGIPSLPTLIDLWDKNPSTYTLATTGSPVIDVWNFGASGWGISRFITELAFLFPAVGQGLMFAASSHNDSSNISNGYWRSWQTILDTIKTRVGPVPVVMYSENPEMPPAPWVAEHAKRSAQMRGFAYRNGAGFVDVFGAFNESALPLASLVQTDGIHPLPIGYTLWADTFLGAWDKA